MVCYALFPLYPKLRLTARELIGIGLDMMPIVRSLLSQEERQQLNAELFFMHGGDYQKQLLALGLDDPQRVERFVSEVSLPRYVGIVRFQLHDAALVDIVCDTTDIRRDYPAARAGPGGLPVHREAGRFDPAGRGTHGAMGDRRLMYARSTLLRAA